MKKISKILCRILCCIIVAPIAVPILIVAAFGGITLGAGVFIFVCITDGFDEAIEAVKTLHDV